MAVGIEFLKNLKNLRNRMKCLAKGYASLVRISRPIVLMVC